MHQRKHRYPLILFVLILVSVTFCSRQVQDTYLIKIHSDETSAPGACGYINTAGDTVIALGTYLFCYTDTLKNFAIVMKKDGSLIAIDKTNTKLFDVYKYDNGPDYISEGLFRILKNGKIGYANRNGTIVIEPRFSCALPFKNGRAKVSLDCKQITEGEHSRWESEHWFYIDLKGHQIE